MACNSQFDRIMRDCRITLPGALDDVIKQEFFNAADEFFKFTHIWQELISLGVDAGQKIYDLDSNEWVAVIDILMGVYTDTQIPVLATMSTPGVLELVYAPSDGAVYNVGVALTVADCAVGQCGCGNASCSQGFPQVPQWILQAYRETFKDGVLCRMMSQLAKPYYNEKLAIYHGQRFRNGMATARMQAMRHNLFNNQAWVFPYFASGRR